MITLTLNQALAASTALSMFPKVNAKAAYDLARMRNALQAALKPLGEQERVLISEHGGQIGEGGIITWPQPKASEAPPEPLYRKAWADLLEHETQIEREPVKLSTILGPDPAKYPDIQPELLAVLEKIIVE